MSDKWTIARRGMLRQLGAGPGSYASYYPPLAWLLDKGYAEGKRGKFSTTYCLTALGKTVLAQFGDA